MPQLLLVGAELLSGGSAPWMQPRALTLELTLSKELAGRGEPRRQERAVQTAKAAGSVRSGAGCSDRGFSQLCLGPACSIVSCVPPRSDASLTIPHQEKLQSSR